VQERIDVPEPPIMLFEDKLQEIFVELVVTLRPTVPPNPLIGLIIIVEVPAAPTLVETLFGLAATLKSCT